jgi:hypothetical protein
LKGEAEAGNKYGLPNRLNLHGGTHGTNETAKVHASNNYSLLESSLSDEGYAESKPILYEHANQDDSIADNETQLDLDVMDSRSPYVPDLELGETSPFAIAKSVGNPTLEPLYNLPIEPSRRNAELYHMCRSSYAKFQLNY